MWGTFLNCFFLWAKKTLWFPDHIYAKNNIELHEVSPNGHNYLKLGLVVNIQPTKLGLVIEYVHFK